MRDDLRENAENYCKINRLVLGEELGTGVQGIVFSTFFQSIFWHSAIKAHEHEACYRRERDVYLRLREFKISEIRGCAVPQLINFADHLRVIEMSVVSRPFVLDFAGAFLDWDPEFSEEIMAQWEQERIEEFGERWREAKRIKAELEGYGIFLTDIHPWNLALA